MKACDKGYNRCLAKKQELCEQVKAYEEKDASSIFWKDESENVKRIQGEWNDIGFLPQIMEKDLRDAFQETCNNFFEKQKEFYTKRDNERNENLRLKTEICVESEELAESDDWNRTSSRLKTLQRSWKEIGPVPKKEGEDLWLRFRTACNTFFENLEKHKPENLKLKQDLCEQVENYVKEVNEETDLSTLSRTVMDLQRQWKEIGPVTLEETESIWERFQKACNDFFQLRNDFIKKRKKEEMESLRLKENLVIESEKIATSNEWEGITDRFKELQEKWHTIDELPPRKEKDLWERFNEASDYFFTQKMINTEDLDTQAQDNLKEKEKICLSLEILAKLTLPEKRLEYNKFIPMAEQLSIALEYKDEIITSGDEKTIRENAQKKIKQLEEQWKEIGKVSDRYDESILNRYKKDLDRFK